MFKRTLRKDRPYAVAATGLPRPNRQCRLRVSITTEFAISSASTKIATIQKAADRSARADKIVRDYLSEVEQDSTADTFPMIGLPNDISRPDRAVRQAFEGCA